jgi:hypothetical protein
MKHVRVPAYVLSLTVFLFIRVRFPTPQEGTLQGGGQGQCWPTICWPVVGWGRALASLPTRLVWHKRVASVDVSTAPLLVPSAVQGGHFKQLCHGQ